MFLRWLTTFAAVMNESNIINFGLVNVKRKKQLMYSFFSYIIFFLKRKNLHILKKSK